MGQNDQAVSAPVDVLRPYARDTGAFRVNNKGATELAEALAAVAQLLEDNRAALVMLEDAGLSDEPVAGFLRAALARVQGGAL